ncbi:MAG: hypothetical protein JJE52_08235 [Acidimicrobiia bacterium]|nr:hypothetical protein [Acidimicrobiia bacterium]
MSAADQDASVSSLRDFLSDMLRDAIQFDRQLHTTMSLLRERKYALDLAEDAEFTAETGQFTQNLNAGEYDDQPGMSAQAFADRYLVK